DVGGRAERPPGTGGGQPGDGRGPQGRARSRRGRLAGRVHPGRAGGPGVAGLHRPGEGSVRDRGGDAVMNSRFNRVLMRVSVATGLASLVWVMDGGPWLLVFTGLGSVLGGSA